MNSCLMTLPGTARHGSMRCWKTTSALDCSAQNAMADLGLSQEAIARLAPGIAAEVLYAFAVDWSPNWVKPAQYTRGRNRATSSPGARPASWTPRQQVTARPRPPRQPATWLPTPHKPRAQPCPRNNPKNVSHI